MRSYENSGYNPYNDTDTTRTRGSARNYYSGDFDMTDRHRTGYGSSAASGYGNRNSGMGSGIDAYSKSGSGRTVGSFYDSPRTSNTSGYGYSEGDSYRSRHNNNDNDGSFWDKAESKVSSWFNDDDNDNNRRGNRDNYYDSDRNYSRNSYNRGNSGTYNSGSSYSGNYGPSNYGTGYSSGQSRSNYDNDRYSSGYGGSSSYGSGSYGSSNYGSGNRDRMGYNSSYGNNDYRSSDSYNSGDRYSSNQDRHNNDHDRGFLERAGDTVKSWFGDDDSDRRRSHDRNSYGSSSGYAGSRNTYGGPPYSYGSSSRRDYEW